LRFYAALSVVVHHFVAPVYWFDDPSAKEWHWRLFFMGGRTALTLFFALAGFLILYGLIREKDTTGTVSVKRFYIRRIFRILPLYYLTLFVGAVITFLTWNAASDTTHQEASNPLFWIAALFFSTIFYFPQHSPFHICGHSMSKNNFI
jgi:peptidoglycan/LPS O-acetylase OafA/YrhL